MFLLYGVHPISYEDIFIEQLKNFMQRGDVVVAISGSGNSPNVVKAVKWAYAHGAKIVGMLGFDGGKLKRLVDVCVHVPVNHYGYVEGTTVRSTTILSKHLSY